MTDILAGLKIRHQELVSAFFYSSFVLANHIDWTVMMMRRSSGPLTLRVLSVKKRRINFPSSPVAFIAFVNAIGRPLSGIIFLHWSMDGGKKNDIHQSGMMFDTEASTQVVKLFCDVVTSEEMTRKQSDEKWHFVFFVPFFDSVCGILDSCF